MKALVVWPQSDRLFGHVFLAVPVDGLIIELDGRHGVPLIVVRRCYDDCASDWYAALGWAHIEVTLPDEWAWNPRPLMLATCVGMVKRYLNIKAWWVQTPAQLYRHIKRMS